MYIKVKNGVAEKYPYTLQDLRSENPQVSFPKLLTPEVLEKFDVFSVQTIDELHQDHTTNVAEGTPVFEDGVWKQVWVVTDATPQDIANRTIKQAAKVRDKRGQLLSQSDWTQVADTPVDQQAWATYRQALRDVPAQEGFPWDVTWPEAPGA